MRGNMKRNVALATMGLLVCGAVALNWTYTGQEGLDAGTEAGKVVGQATLVSGETQDPKETNGTELIETDEDTVGEVVESSSDYFATARLTRQQARDSAVALLQQAAAQEDADETVANEASESIQVLATFTLAETQIENLVTAKGYTDCVAFMGEDSVSVVVSTEDGELSVADIAKISDITMTETGCTAEQVKIVAAN